MAFVVFVVAGGLIAARWPRLAWIHLPAAAWGVVIELAGWTCPLTPLENHLRERAGLSGYSGGFIEHYLSPIVYPPLLDSRIQLVLAVLVVAVNAIVYGAVFSRRRSH